MLVSSCTVLVMSFRHLHRLDQELAAIATVNGLPHRHGRQYSSREDALLSTIAKERELFEGAGFGEYVRTNVYICVHSCTPDAAQDTKTHIQTCLLTQYPTTHRHSTLAVIANASTEVSRRPKHSVCFSSLCPQLEAPDLLEPKKFEAFRCSY